MIQPGRRWRRSAVATVAMTWLWLALPTSARAQSEVHDQCFFPGRDVTVPVGQTIECRSLRVIGGTVVIEADAALNGNLEVGGGDAQVAGRVAEDVFVVGDLTLTAGGAVGGNVFVTGDLTLPADAEIAGDVTVLGAADVAGRIVGDLTAAGSVSLRPTANVSRVSAGGVVDRAPGAQVRDADGSGQGGGGPAMVVLVLLFTLLSALFSGLLASLAATAVDRVKRAAGHSPLLSLVVGLVAWGASLLLALVLLPTLVGPVLVLLAVAAGLLLGWVAFSQWLGRRIWPSGSASAGAALGGAVLAFTVIFLIGAGSLASGISGASGAVVCLGFALLLVLWTWGLGAGLLTLFGLRAWPAELEPAASGPPPPPLPGRTAEAGMVAPAAALAADGGAGTEDETVAAVTADDRHQVAAVTADDQHHTEAADQARREPVDARSAAADAAGRPEGEAGDPQPTVADDAEDRPPVEPDVGRVGDGGGGDTAAPIRTAAARHVREVPGISPIYAMLLAQAGLGTAGELAAADPARVSEAVAVPGVVAVDASTVARWIGAARLLAEGE